MDVGDIITGLRLHHAERPDVEVKNASGGLPDSVTETICAFANLPGGGTIILGLDESQDFRPVKLPDPATLASGLASRARTGFDPPVHIDVRIESFEGHELVVANISELPPSSKPCRAIRTQKAYLRFADGDYALSQLEIDSYIANRTRPLFDTDPVERTTLGDLDRQRVGDFTATARAADRNLSKLTDDTELLTKLGVLTVDGIPTVAGLLALGVYPQQFLPHCNIRVAMLPDDGLDSPAVRAVDSATLTGPIAVILEDAVAWVARNSRRRIVENPVTGHVSEQLDPPPIAVREFIANSLVHRDLAPWASSRSIELRMSASDFRLSNPGGLYGISAERLGTHPLTSARNRQLIEICKYVRTNDGNVVEALATGIPRAIAALRNASLGAPRFFDQGLSFTVTLDRRESSQVPRPSLRSAQRPRPTAFEHDVLALLEQPTAIEELVDALGITSNAVHKRLASLRAKGLVVIIGGDGQRSRYVRVPQTD
jgi:ATP-dependent DNA helicase RecG